MTKEIDQNQVRKVARLSRLDLTNQELEEFTGQLRAILDYVEKMNELDTDNVEPLAHCLPIANVLREDEVRESLGTDRDAGKRPAAGWRIFQSAENPG